MVRVTIAMILLGQMLVTNLAAQESRTAQAIPSTISPEAQEFLRNPPPPLPSPKTPAEWKALRDSIEEQASDHAARRLPMRLPRRWKSE